MSRRHTDFLRRAITQKLFALGLSNLICAYCFVALAFQKYAKEGHLKFKILDFKWPSLAYFWKEGHLKFKILDFGYILAQFSTTKWQIVSSIIYMMLIYVLYKHANVWL